MEKQDIILTWIFIILIILSVFIYSVSNSTPKQEVNFVSIGTGWTSPPAYWIGIYSGETTPIKTNYTSLG